MNYEKIYPRKWYFECAQSGMHPDWSFKNARRFVEIAQLVAIEPWQVFPGTRQVTMETYGSFTSLQLSRFSELLSEENGLAHKIDRVWSCGDRIYIDYVGRADDKIAATIPDFKVGDVLQDLVSDEVAEVASVDDKAFGLRFTYGGYVTRYAKSIVKCGYKLIKHEKVSSRKSQS